MIETDLLSTPAPSPRHMPFPEMAYPSEDPEADFFIDAARTFGKSGTLLLRNCFAPNALSAVYQELNAESGAHKGAVNEGRALSVGDRRYMVSLSMEGALGNPSIMANPKLLPLMEILLGTGFILGSLTTVLALGGSKAQQWHYDNDTLFPHLSDFKTPPFLVSVIVPLINLTPDIGATEVIPTSHLNRNANEKTHPSAIPEPQLGDCYLMDSRLRHRGLPNRSKTVRPILCIIYQRPWYRDYQNFKKQPYLSVSPKTINALPPEMRHLLDWALHP